MLNDTPKPALSNLFATDRQMETARTMSASELADWSNSLLHKLSRDFNEFFEQGEKA